MNMSIEKQGGQCVGVTCQLALLEIPEALGSNPQLVHPIAMSFYMRMMALYGCDE